MSSIIQASPVEKLFREPLPTGDSRALIILGASGDLTNRKLIPGLCNLACERFARHLTEINVHLKPTPQALFASTSSTINPNVVTIRIQPDERISIAFGANRTGTETRTVTVQANFSYQASFESKGPVAYETLLLCLDARRCNAIYPLRRSRSRLAHHYSD